MNAKHTPGPWKTRKGFSSDEIEIFRTNATIKKPFKPTAFAIVRIDEDTQKSVSESRANARLIAAAPELLEALEMLMQFAPNLLCDDQYELGVWADARSAIAKAKGVDE